MYAVGLQAAPLSPEVDDMVNDYIIPNIFKGLLNPRIL